MRNFFRRLFGKKQADNKKRQKRSNLDGPIVIKTNLDEEISEKEYEAMFLGAKSPDGNYKIIFERKGNYKIEHLGRRVGNINIDDVSYDCMCIANNGNMFFLTRDNPSELETTVLIYSKGKYKGSLKAGALSGKATISSDGELGLFKCYSSKTEDSGKLIVFKLSNPEILSKFYAPADGSDISINKNCGKYQITFKSDKTGEHISDIYGNLFDPEKYAASKWEKADFPAIIMMVEDEIACSQKEKSTLSSDRIDLFVSALDRIRDSAVADGSTWRAEYYRTRGKCEDLAGNTEQAIKLFEKALALKPKIGVKRRYNTLLKNSGAQKD